MYKALSPRESGSAQGFDSASLTTGDRTAGNTETCLAARRFEASLAEIPTIQIDG